MPQISKEKIEQLKKVVANAAISHFKSDLPDIILADQLLQELLDQPEGETIGCAEHLRLAIAKVCEGFTLHDGARKILETALFTHPAPFTPIKADDVTDEMVNAFQEENMESCTDRQTIADAVNAYMGAKK